MNEKRAHMDRRRDSMDETGVRVMQRAGEDECAARKSGVRPRMPATRSPIENTAPNVQHLLLGDLSCDGSSRQSEEEEDSELSMAVQYKSTMAEQKRG